METQEQLQKQTLHVLRAILKTSTATRRAPSLRDASTLRHSCYRAVADAISKRQRDDDILLLLSTSTTCAHALLLNAYGTILVDSLQSKRQLCDLTTRQITYQVPQDWPLRVHFYASLGELKLLAATPDALTTSVRRHLQQATDATCSRVVSQHLKL